MVHSHRYSVLEKEVGETPLEAIQKWKQTSPIHQDVPVAYAGRLDPMASGKLLILIGEECKKQTEYTGLDKEYVVEVLLDISSDTGDVLGIPTGSPTTASLADINGALSKEIGTHLRKYPAYSSKTVNGKPLFLHALEGKLGTIQIPEHPESIYKIKLLGTHTLTTPELKERVEGMLAKAPVSDEPSKVLGADFRIKEVLAGWNSIWSDAPYTVLKLSVTCGTGTYMRTLADRIGGSLGSRGLALSIHRTRIGKFSKLLGFFWKEYR